MTSCYKIEQKKTSLYVFHRNAELRRGTLRIRGFRPRFYIPVEESANWHTSGEPIEDVKGRLVKKMYTTRPGEVGSLRSNFTFTDEADVPFEIVWMVETGITCGFEVIDGKCVPCEDLDIPLRVGRFDIEVKSPVEIMPKVEHPIYPIVSFTVKDSYTNRKITFIVRSHANETNFIPDENEEVVYCVNEIELLDKASSFVRTAFEPEKYGPGFDVMQGWYSNKYDWLYIWARCRRIRFDYKRFSPIRIFQVTKIPPKDPSRITRQEKEQPKWRLKKIGGFECQDLIEHYKTFTKPEGEKGSWDLKFVIGEESKGKSPPTYFCKHCENKQCPLMGKHGNDIATFCSMYLIENEKVFKCLGATYVDYGDQVGHFHTKNHRVYIRYCFNDVDALQIVDDARNLVSYYDRARKKVGGLFGTIHIRHHLVKPFLLRLADKPLPTGKKTFIRKKVKGAHVETPVFGLHENVAVFDIRSIYPIIIVNLNLSAETKDPNGELVAANGIRFKKSPEGVIPRGVRGLMDEREFFRNQRILTDPDSDEYENLFTEEQTTKYTTRSLYGITNMETFCLYDPDVTNAVTSTGRAILIKLIAYMRSIGYEVVYGDTDSLHVKLQTTDWREGIDLEGLLKEFLVTLSEEMGFTKYILDIEYEKFYRRVFYKAKKRYCGFCEFRDKKPYNKLVIWGMAPKRSDSAVVTREVVENFLSAVNLRGDPELGIQIVRDAIYGFKDRPLTEIGIPKGLSRRPETYDHFPWASGVLWSRKHLKFRFREDKKPKLLYGYVVGKPLPRFGKRKTMAFCIEDQEQVKDAVINWNKMIDRTIKRKIEPLMIALGLDWTSITSPTRPTKMDAYCE